MLHLKERKVKVHVKSAQQEENNTDYGIEAIVLAYFVTNNTDPSIVYLDKSNYENIYFCFQNSNMVSFPLSSGKERKNKRRN